MHISDYHFGRLTIDGRGYDSDLLITRRGVLDHWRRRNGHSLCMEDLREVLKRAPGVLVIGTGFHSRMQVPRETACELKARGIDLHCLSTTEAVDEFNRLQQQDADVAAALHLTC